MKILHTSDWHLGKTLDGRSREEEHRMFLNELHGICSSEKIDLILLAGDVYDNGNPSAASEELFYKSAIRLTDGGRRPMIAIAGNHDSAERLAAADILAYEHGLILMGLPFSTVKQGQYPGYSIKEAGPGFFELEIAGQSAIVAAMPYPGERRLNYALNGSFSDEAESRKSYSEKIGEIFQELSTHFRADTVNIAIGHFYAARGIESGSERPIQLGGAYAVDINALPSGADYTALGHLHGAQRVTSGCYYCGSPLQLDRGERSSRKYVYIITAEAGKPIEINRRELSVYKPIITITAEGAEEAAEKCRAAENSWIYLNVITDRPLEQQEIKDIRASNPDIIEIIPSMNAGFESLEKETDVQTPAEQFAEFYSIRYDCQPPVPVMDLFLELTEGAED